MKLSEDICAYKIIGCAIRVYSILGKGYLESTYGDALEVEFAKENIPYEREGEVRVMYDGVPLKTHYRTDFTCYDGKYVVELKALKRISNIEYAQTIHYLKAVDAVAAILINFGEDKLRHAYFSADDYKSHRGSDGQCSKSR